MKPCRFENAPLLKAFSKRPGSDNELDRRRVNERHNASKPMRLRMKPRQCKQRLNRLHVVYLLVPVYVSRSVSPYFGVSILAISVQKYRTSGRRAHGYLINTLAISFPDAFATLVQRCSLPRWYSRFQLHYTTDNQYIEPLGLFCMFQPSTSVQ